MVNLVTKARDSLWEEESSGSGKKPERMHGIHLNFSTMERLQGVGNDIDAPNSFKNSCPGIKTLNHIQSEPVNVFVKNIWPMPACNLHSMCNFFCAYIFVLCNLYCPCESIVLYCVGVMLMRL